MDNRTGIEDVRLFAEVAQDYCRVIEQVDSYAIDEFEWQVAQLLCLLYHRVSSLPLDGPGSEDVPHDDTVVYAQLASRIAAKLDGEAIYWEIFNPYELTPPDRRSLGDDLVNIYRDLMDGLSAYHKGTDPDIADAVFHWRGSFVDHWGRHLVDALRPLWEVSRYYLPGSVA